jgi:glycosyltransferase involved in cell wall biosynthesis
VAKRLLVEGWRSSSHSYALVNQHQLLHLLDDPRFAISHRDLPFYRPHWAGLESGLAPEARARLLALPPPTVGRSDVIYRISWPLHMYGGAADRVFVFGTSELGQFPPGSFCGPAGTMHGVDTRAVEIVTPSRWSREGFLAAGFAPERVHVIPHGVEPAEFSPTSAEEKRVLRAAHGIPADALVFLSIGAMTWNKGIGPLLAAFAQLRLRDQRALLLLKGGDALYGNQMSASAREALQRTPAVNDPRVVASIRYGASNLSRFELARLYRLADAYVSPYRAEGFNIPVLEALACGLPVIVTGGGSTDDFCPDAASLRIEAQKVSDGRGRYLEPDLDSLLDAMQRIASDAAIGAVAATEGPRWVAAHYSWAAIAARLGDVLGG